jgi:hypothetical protein
MNDQMLSLQALAAPDGTCYGCGSAHPSGLHLQSHWDADGIHLLCRHAPDETFIGWPGLVYGGLLAMLVDCHSNWTAMAYHYRAEGREAGSLPRIDCVTGSLGLNYLKPTRWASSCCSRPAWKAKSGARRGSSAKSGRVMS